MPRSIGLLAMVVLSGLVVLCSAFTALGQVVTVSEQAEKTLTIKNVTLAESRLLGEITNHSENRVKDISLMVQNSWRWKDGCIPEIEAPLKAVLLQLQKDLLPGETATFSYVISLPRSIDEKGHLVTDVSVAGFKVVPAEQDAQFSSLR